MAPTISDWLPSALRSPLTRHPLGPSASPRRGRPPPGTKRVLAGLFLAVGAAGLGACTNTEPVDEPGPDVDWDEGTGQCLMDGTPVTVNGASSEEAWSPRA